MFGVFFFCSFFANLSDLAHYYKNIFIMLFDCFYVFSPAFFLLSIYFKDFTLRNVCAIHD